MSKLTYPIAEKHHAINGVPGRMHPIHAPQFVRGRLVYRAQKWISEARPVSGYGTDGKMHVEMRFDDECKNGHQSFSITASVYTKESHWMRDIAAGGCLHEEIENTFPELAPFIRWHLFDTDGPMHYVANTVYHAGDRDHNGRRKGEPSAWNTVIYFGNSPVSHAIGEKFAAFLQSRMIETPSGNYRLADGSEEFRVIEITADNKPGGYQYRPHYTFPGFGEKWHECPFKDKETANQWAIALNTMGARFGRIVTAYSTGKPRDLDAARNCACWPEATEAELCAEPEELKAALLARLPGLINEFRAAMENAGFMWEPDNAGHVE